ncbi:MAG: DUF1549 domain-containing protein [Planctomyces sp.]
MVVSNPMKAASDSHDLRIAIRNSFRSAAVLLLMLSLLTPVQSDDAGTAGEVSDPRVSFRHDVMAVLSRSGCNQGSCHGSSSGRGGFRLSLRGQDPDADYPAITREFSGRRINAANPDESLLLLKALMKVPHEGGRRFASSSHEHQILRQWIVEGAADDRDSAPSPTHLEVFPPSLTVEAAAQRTALTVVAHFSDQTTRDVTQMAVYDSSTVGISVTDTGEVALDVPGLTTVVVRYLTLQQPVRVEIVRPDPGFQFSAPQPKNAIDQHVFAQLQRLKINPSPVCDDAVFVRRAWLDLTGQLPPVNAAREFVQSTVPDKRSQLIDRLLASEEFVDQQASRWADLLRVEEKSLDPEGLRVYHQWIRSCVASDMPLNQMAAELISARGSTYKAAPSNFYRALRTPEERSETCAQLMLGIRLACAKCHNHPFDQWTQDDYYNWTNFFGRIDYDIIENKRRDTNDKHEFVGEQIVKILPEGEVTNVRTGQPATLRFLGEASQPVPQSGDADRLQVLAEWMASPQNRRFAVAQVNRIWYQLMGRGIVDPIDDLRATNPPVNPELLTALTDEFISSGYNVRHLFRLIMNSHTWQASSDPVDSNQSDEMCFSHVIPRRLSAEQLLDAISTVLQVPAQYGGHPEGTRATQLLGVRNGDFRFAEPSSGDRFLKLFGRPGRLESCECERTSVSTLAQTLEMISGETVTRLMQHPENRIGKALASSQEPDDYVEEIYWSALTRPPSTEEKTLLIERCRLSQDFRAAYEDITWVLLNSNEFLLRR